MTAAGGVNDKDEYHQHSRQRCACTRRRTVFTLAAEGAETATATTATPAKALSGTWFEDAWDSMYLFRLRAVNAAGTSDYS